jgi:hypothetical protein
MRFNYRSRGLLLTKFRLVKGRLRGRDLFHRGIGESAMSPRCRQDFFTVDVHHNFRQKMNEKHFQSTIPIAAAGSSQTGRSSI